MGIAAIIIGVLLIWWSCGWVSYSLFKDATIKWFLELHMTGDAWTKLDVYVFGVVGFLLGPIDLIITLIVIRLHKNWR